MRKILLGILILLAPVAYGARTGGAVAGAVYIQSSTDLPAINDGTKYTWNMHMMNANAPGTAAFAETLSGSGGAAANLSFGFEWDRVTVGASGYHRDSGGFKIATVGTGLNGGQWYWIAGVYDGTNLKVYVDGVESATVAAGALDRTDLAYRFLLFANKTGAAYSAEDDSNVEQVSWWPATKLTVNEVKSLAAGESPLNVHRTGLVLYWPLMGEDSPERDFSYNTTLYGGTLNNSPAQLKHWSNGKVLFHGLR